MSKRFEQQREVLFREAETLYRDKLERELRQTRAVLEAEQEKLLRQRERVLEQKKEEELMQLQERLVESFEKTNRENLARLDTLQGHLTALENIVRFHTEYEKQSYLVRTPPFSWPL